MKNIFKKLLVALSLVVLLLLSLGTSDSSAATYKAGDIFVTKSTSSAGLTGHTGIAISSTNILHITGPGAYPKVISISKWLKDYPKTKVVRPNSSTLGTKAASEAKKAFQDKKISYSVTINPKNISKTYCSEIVWYSYYKAGKTFLVPSQTGTAGTLKWLTPSIIKPYDFVHGATLNKNGFKFIDDKW